MKMWWHYRKCGCIAFFDCIAENCLRFRGRQLGLKAPLQCRDTIEIRLGRRKQLLIRRVRAGGSNASGIDVAVQYIRAAPSGFVIFLVCSLPNDWP